jgi:hypothetical protein
MDPHDREVSQQGATYAQGASDTAQSERPYGFVRTSCVGPDQQILRTHRSLGKNTIV